MTTDEPLLEVVDLTKWFGGYAAVQGVHFCVAKGEVRGIIGPNGAGKTTLFNLLSGHLKPSSGRIALTGMNIIGKAPHRIAQAGISRAFQTTNIFPTFSVFDNVLISVITRERRQFQFWGRQRAVLTEKVDSILEMVHLQDKRALLASTLAHGDQRALEVAIALGSDPKVMLLDEPTAGMSPFETQEMIHLLARVVKARQLTVVLSEHDMGVVFGLADQITVVVSGQVLAEGTPEEIKLNVDVKRAYLGEGA